MIGGVNSIPLSMLLVIWNQFLLIVLIIYIKFLLYNGFRTEQRERVEVWHGHPDPRELPRLEEGPTHREGIHRSQCLLPDLLEVCVIEQLQGIAFSNFAERILRNSRRVPEGNHHVSAETHHFAILE